MRLFVDDVRSMPAGFDRVVRTSAEAIALLKTGKVTFLSLDHDLGSEDTGYAVALFIERAAALRELGRLDWRVHSANPVGASRIRQALECAERFWIQAGQ
jgi:hypothetical protein